MSNKQTMWCWGLMVAAVVLAESGQVAAQTALQESTDFLAAGLKQADLCQPQAGRACRHSMLP